jgi:hypothetical protein
MYLNSCLAAVAAPAIAASDKWNAVGMGTGQHRFGVDARPQADV